MKIVTIVVVEEGYTINAPNKGAKMYMAVQRPDNTLTSADLALGIHDPDGKLVAVCGLVDTVDDYPGNIVTGIVPDLSGKVGVVVEDEK